MIKTEKYYNSLDKRTKEYKEWVAAGKPIEVHEITDDEAKQILKTEADKVGLGDYVERATKATGIKSIVEWITDDCGCEERKEKLNRFGSKLRDLFRTPRVKFLEQDEYSYLKDFKKRYNGRELEKADQIKLLKIHNRVFNTRKEISTCATCLKDLCNKMIRLYDEHNK